VNVDDLVATVRIRRRLPEPRIRRLVREAAGISQSELAETLGVSTATVCRWESGKRRPRGAALESYVRLLDELRSLEPAEALWA
jgi:DNA-binding transcriptional regulator YiaG